jgi:DNA-binding LacI/PurR family transcriptional regulator
MRKPATKKTKPKTGRERAAAYRARMQKNGMRLVQHWVADVRSPEFRARVNAQLRELADSTQEKDDQAFVDSLTAEVWQDIEREEG